ncbi:MAG TPA: hypothetical protein VNP98_07770 [Chthoniobacterales bacterium]|nr:hypothetical protein [Chthoniobacterales bacterium]
MSRPTVSELAWPMDADSQRQAQEWAGAVGTQVLDWTWRAFDLLRSNTLSRIDLDQPLEQLERDLTSHHFREIQQLWKRETDGYSAVSPQPEWPEMATRSPAPARPPAYDIAFVWNDNPRVAWPFEAKVVATTGTLAAYVADTEKFTDGTAAPYIGEGAQIAYLLTGLATEFFSNLSKRLASKLLSPPEFAGRAHRSSNHTRESAPDLRLHHMAMLCGGAQTQVMLPGFGGIHAHKFE